MGDLDHRRRERLDRAQVVAWDSHGEVEDNLGHGSWEDLKVVHAHRKWSAALAVDRAAFHHVEAALHRCCGDAGMQCGPARKLAPGRRRE